MLWAQVFQYAAGISSVLSLAAFLGALYVWLQSRRSEQSVVEIVKGQGIVDAATVVRVLKQFKSDEARLAALQHMLGYDASRAADVLQKVKANVDVQKISLQHQTHTSRKLTSAGVVMVIFAALATWGTLRTEPYGNPARGSNTEGEQGASSQTGSPQGDSNLINYTGTVRDAKSNRPIGGAKVTITEDQGVPQKLVTDSEGVFYAKLRRNSDTILLTIDAVGYKEYTRRSTSVPAGAEDIFLEPEPPSSGEGNHDEAENIPFLSGYPPVGGRFPECPCIAYANDSKGLTVTNNCPGNVPLVCVKDTQAIPPNSPASFDMLMAAPGRLFANVMIPSGKKAFFDATGKVQGGCQYFACPGTNLQPFPLRCQVGPIQPPPAAACLQNSGYIGQPCTCPNGATGILTQ